MHSSLYKAVCRQADECASVVFATTFIPLDHKTGLHNESSELEFVSLLKYDFDQRFSVVPGVLQVASDSNGIETLEVMFIGARKFMTFDVALAAYSEYINEKAIHTIREKLSS